MIGLPLFGVEFNAIRSPQWLWSIELSTIQSLPKSSSPRGWHETRIETTLTYQPIPDIQLSVLSGWALESGPDEALDTKPWEFQKFIVGGSVTWTPLDWFFLQVSTKDSTFFYGTERLEVGLLQSEAILGLAWGAWRISGGMISGAEHIFEDSGAFQPSFDLWVRW